MPPGQAAFLAAVFGAATAISRVAAGYLLDILFAPHVAAFLYAGATIGMVLLWGGVDGGWQLYLAVIMVGVAYGAEGDIMPFLVTRYFGLRAFGSIYGYVFAAYILGGVLGPMLMGIGFDYTGAYVWPLGISVLITAVAAFLMLRLRPYETTAA